MNVHSQFKFGSPMNQRPRHESSKWGTYTTPTLLHQIYDVFAKQSKWQRRDPDFATDSVV